MASAPPFQGSKNRSNVSTKVIEVGALVLFCAEVESAVHFYRAIGVPLEAEEHDGGPKHYACEIGGCHFALFKGHPGVAPSFRSAGYAFPGFVVASVDESLAAARALGANVLADPELYPWGRRCVIEDPDGRAIEIYERASQSG